MNLFQLRRVSFALAILLSCVLQGCSHGEIEKRIENRISQEAEIKTRHDLKAESLKVIENTPNLSAVQRSQLSELAKSTQEQISVLRSRSLKLRAVLVKSIVSSNYDQEEVETVKSMIKKSEDRQVSLLFDAVEKANTILGRDALQNSRLMNGFFEFQGGHD